MFVSKNQFFIFLACIGIGVVGKILTLILDLTKTKRKHKIIKIIIDVISFVIISLMYQFISYKNNFPSLRAYMSVGVVVGMYLCDKSLNIILAKLIKKIYNITEQIFKIKKRSTNDRKQV